MVLQLEGIELAAMNHRRLVLESGQERLDTTDILIQVGFWVYLMWTIEETQQAGMTKPSASPTGEDLSVTGGDRGEEGEVKV